MVDTVTVRFATNRNWIGGGALFGTKLRDHGSSRYLTGAIDVRHEHPDLPDSGWVPHEQTLILDPETSARSAFTASPSRSDIVSFVEDLQRRIRGRAGTTGAHRPHGIVLIHGFAASFRDSMSRAAQVCRAYGADSVFCFSWPANGVVSRRDYLADRADAKASRGAIAHCLQALLEHTAKGAHASLPTLSLVAHSMGAYALREALQVIGRRDATLLRKKTFFRTVLAAADEDDDCLTRENSLRPLLRLSDAIVVYTAGDDLALTVSRFLHSRPRLGLWGPTGLPGFTPVEKVTSVDCTDVSSTQGDVGSSHYNHQYYRLSPKVIADIRQVLQGVRPKDIRGRLPHPTEPAGGRAFRIPYGGAVVARRLPRRRKAA